MVLNADESLSADFKRVEYYLNADFQSFVLKKELNF